MKFDLKNSQSLALPICFLMTFLDAAEDRSVFFDVDSPGISKSISTWGLEVTWPSYENTVRTLEFMGHDEVDFVRVAFIADAPLVDGQLSAAKKEEMDRMATLASLAGEDKPWALMPGTESGVDSYFKNGTDINAARWLKLMELSFDYYEHPLIFTEPFNEPDYGWGQGTKENLVEICRLLKQSPDFANVPIAGGSTLNCDQAISWHYAIQDYVDLGTTHTLAGSCSNYVAFLNNLASKEIVAMNPEAHNIVDPMIGAEYGMQISMWWGVAEWTRANFVKACQGKRLGYAENMRNWTAASVYRNQEGEVKGFVGASERMATTTTYKFVSTNKDVFFDGNGPLREYSVTIPGGDGYWEHQPNAETMINITWGEDIQPVVGGQYQIVNRVTGMVLEIEAMGEFDGANIVQNLPGSGLHQYWDVAPLDSKNGGDYSYFSIRSAFTGKAADVYNWNLKTGADVRQWEYYGNANQHWILEYAGDGYFYIRSRWSGKYLEVAGAMPVTGGNIQLGDHDETLKQQWRLIPVDAAVEFEPPSAPTGLSTRIYQVSVSLDWNPNTEPDLAGYSVFRSNAPEGPFELIARGLTSTTFVDNNANQPIPYYYKVAAVDYSLNRSALSEIVQATPNGANALVAAYPFEENASDFSGNENHATVSGDVVFDPNAIGMELNGNDCYVQLPATVLNHTKLTISAWVKWFGGEDEQRIFDFGTGPDSCLYLTPKASDDGLQFSICSGDLVTTLNAPALIPNQWSFIEVVFDETTVSLYLGGNLVDTTSIDIRPFDLQPVLNYIGRGQNPETPYFRGRIGDFRIYNFSTKTPNS